MKTAQQISNEIIAHAQKMRAFDVNVPVVDNWLPNGIVPFNMHISDNVATITAIAESYEDAEAKVSEYMRTQHE